MNRIICFVLLQRCILGPIIKSCKAFSIQSNQNPPNILLIITDDQGFHDVSYYGTLDLRTPNIDSLVDSGLRLNRCNANSSVCSPTRASILNGHADGRLEIVAKQPFCPAQII